jgi:DinB family protein
MNSVLATLETTLSQALDSLDAAQTQLRPRASGAGTPSEKWSIQQIVEHLLLTYQSTRGAIQHRLDKGRPTDTRATRQQRIFQFVLITLGHFPEGRPAPPMVTPGPDSKPLSSQQLIASVHEHLVTLDPIFDQAEKTFGDQRATTHQILGPLSIAQWRRFHLIHTRHHARQIRAIRRQHGL